MKKWVYKWLNIGVQALSMNSRLIKQYVLRIRGLSDLELEQYYSQFDLIGGGIGQ